jgi:hypothetical protein
VAAATVGLMPTMISSDIARDHEQMKINNDSE